MVQEILLALSLCGAVAYLIFRFSPAKNNSDCDESCGCDAKNLKPRDASS